MANTTKKHDQSFKYATRTEYRGLNMRTLFFPNGTILKDAL